MNVQLRVYGFPFPQSSCFFVISVDLRKSAFGENRGWGKENTEKREEGGIVVYVVTNKRM